MPYLTGDSPQGSCEVSLTIPNDPMFRRAILGQLVELTDLWVWQQFGSLTDAETVALAQEALETLQFICAGAPFEMLVQAYRTTTFALTNNVWTKLTGLNVVPYDTGEWDESNNQVVLNQDGLYVVQCSAGHVAVNQGIGVRVSINEGNGARNVGQSPVNHAVQFAAPVFLPLADGDIIHMEVMVNGSSSIGANDGILGLLVAKIADLP